MLLTAIDTASPQGTQNHVRHCLTGITDGAEEKLFNGPNLTARTFHVLMRKLLLKSYDYFVISYEAKRNAPLSLSWQNFPIQKQFQWGVTIDFKGDLLEDLTWPLFLLTTVKGKENLFV